MKDVLFNNWGLMRWLRLFTGGYFMFVAIEGRESVLGFLSALFILQALTNTGCGTYGCTPITRAKTEPREPDYEIIKSK